MITWDRIINCVILVQGASYREDDDETGEGEPERGRCSVRDEGRSKLLHTPEFLLDPLLDPPSHPHHFRLLQVCV